MRVGDQEVPAGLDAAVCLAARGPGFMLDGLEVDALGIFDQLAHLYRLQSSSEAEKWAFRFPQRAFPGQRQLLSLE
jgi:hypothetical protein